MGHGKFERLAITSSPTVSTVIYASGDQMGGINTLANACADSKGSVEVESIVVIDQAKQKAAFDVLFFESVPTLTSVDNGAFALSSAELLKCIGVVSIAATDYADTSAQAVATKKSIALILQAIKASKDLYYVMVVRGTPTYVATTDLTLKIGLLQP